MQLVNDKYPVYYTCGTGYDLRASMLRELYSYCYDGLDQFDDLTQLLLPTTFDRFGFTDREFLLKALKKSNTKVAIKKYLSFAIQSVTCVVDKEKSNHTRYIVGRW